MTQEPLRILLSGGLGNQLFQSAVAYHFNLLGNRDCVLVRNENSHSRFDHGSQVEKLILDLKIETKAEKTNFLFRFERKLIRSSQMYSHLRKVQVQKELGFDPNFLIKDDTLELRGYFQSYIYAESLREVYRVSLANYLQDSQLNLKSDITFSKKPISLHLRRGDYETLRTTLGVLDLKYYENALEELNTKEEIQEILVFSDDASKASDILSRSKFSKFMNFKFASSLGEIESLAAMSMCQRHIIANSTFSWWGAFLTTAENSIVAPSKWFRKGDDPNMLIPKHWIQIDSKWET